MTPTRGVRLPDGHGCNIVLTHHLSIHTFNFHNQTKAIMSKEKQYAQQRLEQANRIKELNQKRTELKEVEALARDIKKAGKKKS